MLNMLLYGQKNIQKTNNQHMIQQYYVGGYSCGCLHLIVNHPEFGITWVKAVGSTKPMIFKTGDTIPKPTGTCGDGMPNFPILIPVLNYGDTIQ